MSATQLHPADFTPWIVDDRLGDALDALEASDTRLLALRRKLRAPGAKEPANLGRDKPPGNG